MPAPIPLNDQIVALHEAGVPVRQISKVVGCLSKSQIAKRLKHLTPRKTTEIYRELKADVLAEKQRKLLMASDKLDPKGQQQIATAFGIYHDKERQVLGLSSENIAVMHGVTEELSGLIEAITGKRPG